MAGSKTRQPPAQSTPVNQPAPPTTVADFGSNSDNVLAVASPATGTMPPIAASGPTAASTKAMFDQAIADLTAGETAYRQALGAVKGNADASFAMTEAMQQGCALAAPFIAAIQTASKDIGELTILASGVAPITDFTSEYRASADEAIAAVADVKVEWDLLIWANDSAELTFEMMGDKTLYPDPLGSFCRAYRKPVVEFGLKALEAYKRQMGKNEGNEAKAMGLATELK